MAWKLSLGNLLSRAPKAGVVAGGGSIDPLYPLADIGNGYPDDPTRWVFDVGGAYSAEFDLNLLAATSDRTDAPTGWRDLALFLAGTPGLSATPPDWGTYESRSALRIYGPVFQDIDLMPGEDVRVTCGLYCPTASDATAVKVVVIDLATGKQWDGTGNEWDDSSTPVASQSVLDAWLDVDETITNSSTERVTYRVILTPVGGAGADYYVYVSDPALTAAQDMVALIGHNVPRGATLAWSDGTVTRTVTVGQPSCYATGTASSRRTWTLTITMPTDTKEWTPAPFIGELWAGSLVDLVACPGYPFDIIEGDLGQVRLEGGLGRVAVYTEIERPTRAFKMRFKTTNDSQYEDARDTFLRASRFGADPILLAPVDALEGSGTIWHGRVGPEVTYARTSLQKRTFEVTLRESPFPRFR